MWLQLQYNYSIVLSIVECLSSFDQEFEISQIK